MHGVIVGALLLASGTLMTGCCHDRAARQETPAAEQPAAQPAAPAGAEGGGEGTGGSGSAVGGGEDTEVTDEETVPQEDLGGSDAATERGMMDERNSEPEVPPPGDPQRQRP